LWGGAMVRIALAVILLGGTMLVQWVPVAFMRI
jgi:hypothetical protein